MALRTNRKNTANGLTRGASNAKGAIVGAAGAVKGKAVVAVDAVGAAISSGASAASEKAARAIRDQKERLYNPLFAEDYFSTGFDMPKLVVIADEDARKGVEVCDGAIGWLNTRRIPEIIFMYEEFVPRSNVRFSPRPMCGGVYYRHPFESDLYLQVKDYLKICKRDQLTELKNIACLLGAVHCSVEVHREKGLLGSVGASRNSHAQAKVGKERASTDVSQALDASCASNETLNIVMSESFEPGATPQRPELQWFAHDNEILSLIEKRCNPNAGGVLSSYSIDITASTSSTISIDLASSIDASLGAAKVKAGNSLAAGLKKEEKKHFVYKIEF